MLEHVFEERPGLQAHPTTSWPSPAADYYDGGLSLDRAMITHPESTFLVRVAGDGLRSEGVLDGDVLIVDRAVDPRPGHVVVVVIEGQHRVGLLIPAAALAGPMERGDPGDGPNQPDQPDQPDARGVFWPSTGHQPWGGAEGWCLRTDDLALPIPSGSTFFGVARYGVHHMPGTAYQPGHPVRPVPADAFGRARRDHNRDSPDQN